MTEFPALSQTSVLGAHAPQIDSGTNGIRFTLATAELDKSAAAAIAKIALVRMVLAFAIVERNGHLG
jgi:hypothetical protein